MDNDRLLNELQKMNNLLNCKDSFSLNFVVKSTDQIYALPQPITFPTGKRYRAALIDFSPDK